MCCSGILFDVVLTSSYVACCCVFFFFFQAEDGIRDIGVTGVQTCALPIYGANDQPLFGRLWGSGFLPSVHQGVKLRSTGDPVLYLSNPPGIDSEARRRMLSSVVKLNQMTAQSFGDPEVNTRIAQYELAYRMQSSVPDLMDLSKEPDKTFEAYGPESKKPGTFA